MKKMIVILAMAIAATSAAFGQMSKDEQAVRQTLNELAAAINAQDMTKLAGFYADDYLLIDPAGVKFNKTERLATIKNEKPNGVFGYENVKIRFYGDTAIVNTNVRTTPEQDATANLTTLVLVKKGKSWQLVSAQGTPAANQSGGDAEQAIRQTMTELFNALNRGDADAAGRIYADDYQIVLENGKTVTKAERVGAMRSGALKFQSVGFSDLRIRVYGNAAIATYRNSSGRSNALGSEQENNSVGTVTLVYQGGRWQVASAHLTKPSAN
jgi:ketosteroid isomerase-like protein